MYSCWVGRFEDIGGNFGNVWKDSLLILSNLCFEINLKGVELASFFEEIEIWFKFFFHTKRKRSNKC